MSADTELLKLLLLEYLVEHFNITHFEEKLNAARFAHESASPTHTCLMKIINVSKYIRE